MIRFEDKAFEDEIITGGSCIAVPFQISVQEGACTLLVYSFCRKLAETFEKRYSEAPFSDEARQFLLENLAPVMESMEYSTKGALEHDCIEYRCRDIRQERILPSCVLLDTLEGETWNGLELDEFELDPLAPEDRMAVIREEGRIVCYAGLNDLSEDDGLYEINVECEEAWRGRGYGTACVACLTEYLHSIGEGVKYVCSDKNLASRKTAEAAGFERYRRVSPFVCYRVHEETDVQEDDEEAREI